MSVRHQKEFLTSVVLGSSNLESVAKEAKEIKEKARATLWLVTEFIKLNEGYVTYLQRKINRRWVKRWCDLKEFERKHHSFFSQGTSPNSTMSISICTAEAKRLWEQRTFYGKVSDPELAGEWLTKHHPGKTSPDRYTFIDTPVSRTLVINDEIKNLGKWILPQPIRKSFDVFLHILFFYYIIVIL